MVAPHLAESTRAKVSVLTSAPAAAEELGRHLGGPGRVPAELGGACALAPDALPAHAAMLAAAAAARRGGGGGGGGARAAADEAAAAGAKLD